MPRPAFEIDLLVTGAPAQVWARLWDLDRHTASVPFTTVRADPSPAETGARAAPSPTDLVQGARFTARTSLGPFRVDDVMVVRTWDPPRHAVIDKVGTFLTGTIEVDLRVAGSDTRLRWAQTFGATGVPDALAGCATAAVHAAYLRTLLRITRP